MKSSLRIRIGRALCPAARILSTLSLWPLLAASSFAATKAPGDPPIIRSQPVARTATDGGHAAFSVLLAPDSQPFSFQWWRNDQPLAASGRISGTTNFVLNIDPLQLADSGNYFVTVSNTVGAVTSSVVSLVVSQIVFNFTPVGGTGAWLNISGQIGDVYRIEVNTNFTGYLTNGYATNRTGRTQYFDHDPGTGFRQIRLRFDHMLPILSVAPSLPDAPAPITAYGKLNQVWRLQGSADFVQWLDLGTVTNTAGWMRINDPTVGPGGVTPPHRFYRISPP